MLRSRYYPLAALALIALVLWVNSCGPRAQPSQPSSEQLAAADKALAWLRTQQKDDGSFDAGFGHPAGVTCDAALAIVAGGGDPAGWRSAADKPSLIDYLAENVDEYAVDAATTGKVVVTVVASALDPRDVGGLDCLARLHSFDDGSGTYDPGTVGQAWAILALAAAGEKVSADTLAVLESYQLESGAWASPFGPDNDTVSYALQALIAGGAAKDSPAIGKALNLFQEQQNLDGGFPAIKPSDWGTDTNANSTASVIMALVAVGEDPAGERWSESGGNPMTALLALQAADGRIEFQPGMGDPLLSTVQAIPALLDKTLPLRRKS